MFNNWLFIQNAKTVLWLNKSYLTKGELPTFLWFLKPSVFIQVIYRLLLIATKVLISLFGKLSTSSKKENEGFVILDNRIQTTDDLSIKLKRSFLDILLFRNIFADETDGPPENVKEPVLKELQLQPLTFKRSQNPLVSIIIPVYNKIEYTYNCLLSLQAHLPSQVETEIIIIDDCSSDETQTILSSLEGIHYIRNEKNLGFLLNCNKAAKTARGHYLCFLNNDTYIRPLWLESLLEVFEKDATTGIAGSKLVYPNGALQEAGGIVWPDGGASNFGNNGNAYDPQFNFKREVDYVSGASLLIKTSHFLELGGFDELYLPAYYEDTDLCFNVKHKLGLKVIYEPKSELLHFEGVSSGKLFTKSNIKKNQLLNQSKFEKKWRKVLQSPLFLSSNNNLHKAARKYCGKKTILVLDSYMPRFDKESGSNRLLHILRILKTLDYHVIFMPDNWNKEEPYTTILQKLGVETLYSTNLYNADLVYQLRQKLYFVDIAWLCRPDIAEKYGEAIKKQNKKTKIIYDTIDLHFLRLKREAELYPDQVADKDYWLTMRSFELKLAANADKVIAITDTDKYFLQQEGVPEKKLVTIPNVHVHLKEADVKFNDRQDLLFIGSYNHPPNIDAVIWLCKEIMPIVWQAVPEMKVTLLGNEPKPEVLALQNEKVIVPGFVRDIAPYFIKSRVFVAPLRYGAGMKGKIGQSYEYGLPIVSTTIGVEGMGLLDEENVLVADDAAAFAAKILKLYTDQHLWKKLADNSEKAILPYSPDYIKSNIYSMLNDL